MDEKKFRSNSPLDLLTGDLGGRRLSSELDSDVEAEEIDESFICCVCLDLLYKPIILACGHISCFWCVNRAMNVLRESHCPICRCPYAHFPGICQLLHFLLLKMYPVAYKGREKQVLEEETRQGCFSPQLADNLLNPSTGKKSIFSITCSPGEDVAQNVSKKIKVSNALEHQSPDLLICEKTPTSFGGIHTRFEATRNLDMEENNLKEGTCELVSVNDVLCVACKEILIKPSVLNCGHVYCQYCIATLADEARRCQICQSVHPKGFLKVCLELDHFLEKRFPKDYALRKEAMQYQPMHGQQGSPSAGAGQDGKLPSQSTSPHNSSYSSRLRDHCLSVHIRVGCDYCGMFPIVGERYKCKDCVEKVGFDLCGECYNTCSKLPGRFNQQHTPEHQFELVKVNLVRRILMQLVSDHSEDSSVPMLSDDASEDLEDGLSSHVLPDDVSEDHEGDSYVTS